MSGSGKNPYADNLRRKVIEPLQDFRHKVSPLNQTHNQSIQDFTTTIMGLLTGSAGGVEFQGPGANALAEMVGRFLTAEQQLAGSDPFTLEGRLQDASVVCERHAQDVLNIINNPAYASSNSSSHPYAALLSALGDPDDGEDEGDDPAEETIGPEMAFSADMQPVINEPLPETPDLNETPANQPPDPALGNNAGFIQNLGVVDDDPANPEPPSDPFEGDVDNAIDRAQQDPNRVHHIFENPTHDHLWGTTGLDQQGDWNLIRQTMVDNQGIVNSTPAGTPGQVTTSFGGYTVVVRYIIINGVLRIADAWVTVP